MFPFELSLFDIASMATIAIILTLYTIFIVKLKLPNEEKPTSYIKLEKKEKNNIKPKKLGKPTTQAEAEEITIEEAVPVVEKQEVPEEPAKEIETKANVEKEENQKKEKESKKAFFLFGKKDFAGCVHKFGYLKTVPRNTPIPDECFGCPKIIECLMQSTNK